MPGFDIGLSASTSSGAQTGDQVLGDQGDFYFRGSKKIVPEWVWFAVVALVGFILWKKFK